MFNTIMRNAMPVWMTLSLLYALFAAAYVIRAGRRLRRLRAMRNQVAGLRMERPVLQEALAEQRDWMPSR